MKKTRYTPEDFKSKFNVNHGATFGLGSSLWQSNHFRLPLKQKKGNNLYFAGSSSPPGAGVAIILFSEKITADEVMLDDGIKSSSSSIVATLL
ncbi:hypothetical protein [Aerococcus sp.]|uniref:hypothetical protein n=1 Tax=Aerococcus sp. TaxID=1872398 RepID=UPI000EDBC519|nr:hypothetical protein [Aerococcus sp.]MBR2130688.1 hypothetical protein [Aerococcus sp.]HCT97616.1 hypothetical protein [Aerococcus urinaeequi]